MLHELQFVLYAMDSGTLDMNMKSSDMLVSAARFRISTLEKNKNKAQE
jgi:hypothetical protein